MDSTNKGNPPMASDEKSKRDNVDKNDKSSPNPGSTENADQSAASSGATIPSMAALRQYLVDKLNLGNSDSESNSDNEVNNANEPVFSPLTFDSLMTHWNEKPYKNIVTLVGAGISTSAGIPDFRSPKTGLYDNLEKYKLPHPQAIFEINYFRKNPKPFYALAKELYPGSFKPTPCHYFIKMLEEKNVLLRHYTQNIDTLERVADISDKKLIEAHGSFYGNHCIKCRKAYDMAFVKEKIFDDAIPKCVCGGTIKPDIVFFGENLPEKFYNCHENDLRKCDLLIIMGTSLEVQPCASLINFVRDDVPRLLINREIVGQSSYYGGLLLNTKHNTRDFVWLGDCDDGVQVIADRLGFGVELKERVKKEHQKIDDSNQASKSSATVEPKVENLKL